MRLTTSLRLSLGVLAVLVTLARIPPVQAGECGRWCEQAFWESATLEDVQVELAKGSDPMKARDKNGGTPLHVAALTTENPAVVTVLLDAGADLKARDKNGRTA